VDQEVYALLITYQALLSAIMKFPRLEGSAIT
jgi:hypothetical protein